MKERESIVLLLFFALALLLSGCATVKPGAVIDPIQKRGELVVGTTGDMPPLNMTTKDGNIIGYEVDLARFIADSMGVKLRLQAMAFSELLPALRAGKVDMVISGMTITPQRNLEVAFVGPYLVSGKSILTRAETFLSLQTMPNVKVADLKLAALKGSTSEAFVQKVLPNAQLVTTKDYDEAVKLVLENKVHAMVADHPICIYSAYRYADQGLVALITPFTYEPLGIALPANDPLLINWLGNLMKSLEGNGQMDKLKGRWFEDVSWVNKLP